MKHPLLILCCAFVFSLAGQNTWQWALAPDSANLSVNQVLDMTLDNTDNVFITGTYNNTLAIAGEVLPAPSGPPLRFAYTAKINKNGSLQWIRTAGSENQTSICTDDLGNSYVLGTFSGSMVASGTTLVSNPSTVALYLLKYASGGNLIWGKIIGKGISSPWSLKYLGNKVYICGSIDAHLLPMNFTLGTYSFSTLPQSNIFYAQLDTSGVVLSADRFGGFYLFNRSCLAVSPNGNITLSTYADGAAHVIGNQTLAATPSNTNLPSEVLINVGAGGSVNWVKRITLTPTFYKSSICSDLNSNIYFATSCQFGPVVVDNFSLAPSSGTISGLLLKLDSLGSPLWGKTFESSACGINMEYAYCGSVNTDKRGKVSVCGIVNGQTLTIDNYTATCQNNGCNWTSLFIAQFDGSGNVAGVLFNTATVAKPNAFQISMDNTYNFIISGYFSGEKLVFGSNTLYGHPTFSPIRLFVAKSGGILTGLRSNTVSNAVTIFPIPSTSEVIFSSENNRIQKITLYDLGGTQVAHKICTNLREELSLTGLAAGIYLARVECHDHQITTVKVVKVE